MHIFDSKEMLNSFHGWIYDTSFDQLLLTYLTTLFSLPYTAWMAHLVLLIKERCCTNKFICFTTMQKDGMTQRNKQARKREISKRLCKHVTTTSSHLSISCWKGVICIKRNWVYFYLQWALRDWNWKRQRELKEI